MSDSLTPKQRAFVREYLVDWNATQAAIRAGYSKGTANEQGSQLLAKLSVQDAISAAIAPLIARSGVAAAQLIQEQARIALSDLGQVLDFSGDTLRLRRPSEIPEAARRSIASMKVRRHVEGRGDDAREVEVLEIKLWSKSDALDKLARILGLYAPEKIAPTTPDGERPYGTSVTLEAVLDRLAALAGPGGAEAQPAGLPAPDAIREGEGSSE